MQEAEMLSFIIQEGECQHIEFKEKIANLDKEIVAFANSSGGSIFLGISDDGTIKGININNALKSELIDIARNCDPSIRVTLVSYSEKKVLAVQVAEGIDKPYRCKDGFFLRIGPSSQKLKRDEIVKLIQDSGKIQFDEMPNNQFYFRSDFSKEALLEFLKCSHISTRLPMEDVLINLGVANLEKNKLIFTNAGILFFGKAPQKFFPESYITAIKYSSHDRFSIIDKQDIYGNLIQQIEQSMHFVLRHISVEADMRFRSSNYISQRENVYEYPIVALREAIVNAVTHRDYFYDSSHIYIHIYPDHIDIENPGGLHRGLTVENLGKRSIRRNRLIADLLHHARYIERVGSGFDRMKQALEQNNNPPMEVKASNFFDIRFYKRVQATNLTKLTQRQIIIYNIFQERYNLTKKEISIALNVSEDTAVRELNNLIKLGIIKKTGKGKAIRYELN